MRAIQEPTVFTWRNHELTLTPRAKRTLLIANAFAVTWWIMALILRPFDFFYVWTDQLDKFMLAYEYFFDPYAGMWGFFSPVWTVVFLVPLALMPLPIAALLQSMIFFSLLALITLKYTEHSRPERFLIIALLSPFGINAILQLSIDWLVCVALLVPPAFSAVFLAIKPQVLPGYVFTMRWREIIRAGIVLMIVMLLSFAVWGVDWLLDFYNEFGTRDLATSNVAPMAIVPPWLSVILGVALLVYAFRKHDDVLKILAGIFFTPYIPTYTALIPFLLFSLRFPRVASVLNFALWLITVVALLAFMGWNPFGI